MSTKIYEAWRIPVSKINDFVDHVRAKALKRAVKIIDECAKTKTVGLVPAVFGTKNPKQAESRARRNKMLAIIEETSKTIPSLYSGLDCWANIWIHGKYAYIMGRNISAPRWASDYSFWNNSDPPKGVSYSKWNARGKMWDKIATGAGIGPGSHNARRLEHNIIDVKNIGTNFELFVTLMGKDWLK